MRRVATTSLASAVALLLGLFVAGDVCAQGMPGPLSDAHRVAIGGSLLSCTKCHSGVGGGPQKTVPDDKCLGCHDHHNLRDRIRAEKGFHADAEVKKKPCKDCHAEHIEEPLGSGKGRKTTIDWKPFGTKRNFVHQRVGWPLDGAHRFQACEKCHKKQYPQTKLPSFLGLRSDCISCHKDDNPHQFTDVKLFDCTICHGFDSRKVPNLGATKFDHDKTKFPLKGNHLKNACKLCHVSVKKFTLEEKDLSECKACHQDSHRSVISTRKCASCHRETVKFRDTKFDHAKETRFPLRGQHAKNRCRDCHKVDGSREKPSMQCVGCHKDDDLHAGRFGKEPCEGCHVETGWKEMRYDHDRKTKFALTGAHVRAKCLDCHRGTLAQKKRASGELDYGHFEKHSTTQCGDCHRHQSAHCGQFGLENCGRCHVRGGDRTSKFDHGLTRFPLDRAHAVVPCERCHKPARLGESERCRAAVKYTGLEPQCLACHEDIHKGTLGKDCAKCHTGGLNFKTLAFDHNRDARFPLTGYHSLVPCAECHPQRKFKLEAFRCETCHKKDDVHVARLGDDCGKCHETTGGAPKFDHDLHTNFLRQGVHRKIECERCHFLPPPEEHDGGDAGSGKADDRAFHVQGDRVFQIGSELDLQFRNSGSACTACHPNPHGVREDLDCSACHSFEQWAAPPRNAYHSTAGFSLTGAHTVVQCSLCHTGSASNMGRGEQCGLCHVQDDIHAGSFGRDCGRCHEQLGWLPTTFTHVDVGFVLEGLHRALECRECHQAGNYFVGRKCYNCHLSDYRSAEWHVSYDMALQADNPQTFIIGRPVAQDALKTYDCGECHNQFSFSLGVYNTPASERGK